MHSLNLFIIISVIIKRVTQEAKSNFIKAVAVLAAVALLVAGYFYFLKPAREGALNTTKNASENVPQITTNAADKVPEINPIDRANPFKYNNPLR